MLQIIVTIKPDKINSPIAPMPLGYLRRGGRRKLPAVTKFDKTREAVEAMGVTFIPNLNAVEWRGQRIRLDFGKHNYSVRDFIRAIARECDLKVSQKLLVQTLQCIRMEKFGH